MLSSSLAFKYVAIALMMAQVNYWGQHLHLKGQFPIEVYDTTVRRASDFGSLGLTGRIDTPEYSFGFIHGGTYRVLTRLEDGRYQSMGLYRGDEPMKDFMNRFARIKSTINTNEAFCLATNWLAAIGIDVLALERTEPVKVQQQFHRSDQGVEEPCPLFYVDWGKTGEDQNGHALLAVIEVMVSGINGELLSLRIGNDAYSKRPIQLIKNVDQLLAIPDEEFLKYSPEERHRLVARFAATNDSTNNPLVLTNAPATEK